MAFTKLLTIYLSAAVVGLLAWVLNAPQLYWMAGALILLPIASRLLARWEQKGLEVSRELPGAAHQGEAVTVRVKVRNLTRFPKLHLTLTDQLPAGLTGARPLPVHLAPLGIDTALYTLQLRRRGVHRLAGMTVESTDMLGLASEQVQASIQSEILVYPRVVPLPDTALPPELAGGQAPLTASNRKGEGSGFFGVREYRPGDPLRHVHWRTAARVGRLAVMEWEADESRDSLIAIETATGTERDLGAGTTLDLAAGLGASLASLLLQAGDSLRLYAPGYSEWEAGALRGPAALSRVLEALARVQASSSVPLPQALRSLAPQLVPGSLICWLAPDLNASVVETVRYLQAARLRPVLYLLGDPSGREGIEGGRLAAELQAAQVPVLSLRAGDELARQLLN